MAESRIDIITNLLKSHNLTTTSQRIDLLNVFFSKQEAMNLADINKRLKQFDRITLYRNLNTFEESGLIHKIPGKEIPYYALCRHETIEHSHNDDHVHFKCSSCDKTICMEGVEIPVIKLPKYYKAQKFSFLIEGICKDCK